MDPAAFLTDTRFYSEQLKAGLCPARLKGNMDEYDPDKPQHVGLPGNEPIRVPIDDRTPLSTDHPKYAEKYAKHVEMGVAMYLCPVCHQLGCHKVTSIDQVGSSRSAGETCDVCGYEDTYEMGA